VTKIILEDAESKLRQLEEKRLAVEELKRREARIHEGIINAQQNAQSFCRTLRAKRLFWRICDNDNPAWKHRYKHVNASYRMWVYPATNLSKYCGRFCTILTTTLVV